MIAQGAKRGEAAPSLLTRFVALAVPQGGKGGNQRPAMRPGKAPVRCAEPAPWRASRCCLPSPHRVLFIGAAQASKALRRGRVRPGAKYRALHRLAPSGGALRHILADEPGSGIPQRRNRSWHSEAEVLAELLQAQAVRKAGADGRRRRRHLPDRGEVRRVLKNAHAGYGERALCEL